MTPQDSPFDSDATVFGFSGETWSLRGVAGEQFGKRFPIQHSLTIGRAPECDLVIASKQVSRHHANLSRLGDLLVIDDLQSSNGTFVNNKRVLGQVELRDGDQIAFSRSERFLLTVRRNGDVESDDNSYARVVDGVRAASAAPTPDPAGDAEEDGILLWVAIGIAIVVLAGVVIWAFL